MSSLGWRGESKTARGLNTTVQKDFMASVRERTSDEGWRRRKQHTHHSRHLPLLDRKPQAHRRLVPPSASSKLKRVFLIMQFWGVVFADGASWRPASDRKGTAQSLLSTGACHFAMRKERFARKVFVGEVAHYIEPMNKRGQEGEPPERLANECSRLGWPWKRTRQPL